MRTFSEFETQIDNGDGFETDQAFTNLAAAKRRMEELLDKGVDITEVRVVTFHTPLDW